jgi:predicted TIM-barrel fold metal-dependent hydrolase
MKVGKIDIHVHTARTHCIPRPGTTETYCSPEELIKKYDELGIEMGVILPEVSPECCNTGIQRLEDIAEICEKYNGRFYWFMNIDPRSGYNNSDDDDFSYYMTYYKKMGAKGIGEVCANMAFNDPKMENLFHHAEKNDLPVIFHISPFPDRLYGIYDKLGLPFLEGALAKFPNLKFLGHSQPFWAEIGSGLTEEARNTYPVGKVKPGRVVELMRKYPNLYGDLSAGSGFNAINRDEEFGISFMEEFQDRLFFGTDICAPSNVMLLSAWLDDKIEMGRISQTVYEKISRKNAEKLLGIS